jgi:hypothetical protein|tara:strand:+ start:201 stop:956 length:756 start_codon:yes stop_codon:yes gene_type:complete
MKKKYSIEIPEFISISKYQELTNMEHLTEIGKMVRTINVFTKIPEDEIKTWAITDMGKVAGDFSNKLDIKSQFYPIIKINDVDYGYTDISSMSLGEFIDLESLCKKPQANLHEIMAVLYRPIKTHRFDKLVWKAKHNVQLMQKKTDNVFKWYTVEEYNNNNRIADSEAMKELPTGFALGALSFFLGTASLYSINSINSSSQVGKMEMEEVKKKTTKQLMEALAAIGDGLVHYIHSPKQAFSISQEKLVSLS